MHRQPDMLIAEHERGREGKAENMRQAYEAGGRSRETAPYNAAQATVRQESIKNKKGMTSVSAESFV